MDLRGDMSHDHWESFLSDMERRFEGCNFKNDEKIKMYFNIALFCKLEYFQLNNVKFISANVFN